jgi:hypothetical protein
MAKTSSTKKKRPAAARRANPFEAKKADAAIEFRDCMTFYVLARVIRGAIQRFDMHPNLIQELRGKLAGETHPDAA